MQHRLAVAAVALEQMLIALSYLGGLRRWGSRLPRFRGHGLAFWSLMDSQPTLAQRMGSLGSFGERHRIDKTSAREARQQGRGDKYGHHGRADQNDRVEPEPGGRTDE